MKGFDDPSALRKRELAVQTGPGNRSAKDEDLIKRIKEDQKEFQEKFCSSCIRFDRDKTAVGIGQICWANATTSREQTPKPPA